MFVCGKERASWGRGGENYWIYPFVQARGSGVLSMKLGLRTWTVHV
jgi:hypothetical protein